jgi:hypothetical protein
MRPKDGTGVMDMVVVILSPLIAAGLVVVYLLGCWAGGVWRWVRGR